MSSGRSDPATTRRRSDPTGTLALRVAAAGLLCMLAAGVCGWVWLAVRLGTSVEATIARVEDDVRGHFARRTADLQDLTTRLLAHPALAAGLSGTDRDERALFDVVAEEAARTGQDVAVTITALDGSAVAWAGRAQTLDPQMLSGRESLFVGPGSLGLRLVYVEPVPAPAGPREAATGGAPVPRRLGTIVAEYVLSPQAGVAAPAALPAPLETPLVTVELMLHFASGIAAPADDTVIVVEGPAGQPLVDARIPRADVVQRRSEAYRQLFGLMGAVAGLVTLVLSGVLGWERRGYGSPGYLGMTGAALVLLVTTRVVWWLALPALAFAGPVTTGDLYASAWLPGVHRSPADLVATAVCALGAIALLVDPVRRLRLHTPHRRRSALASRQQLLTFVAWQLTAGVVAAVLAFVCQALVADTVARARIDMLNLAPEVGALPRVVLQVGLLGVCTALFWGQVLVLRAALLGWARSQVPVWQRDLLPAAAWLLPTLLLTAGSWLGAREVPELALLAWVAAGAVAALVLASGLSWFRHGSQSRRLLTVYGALLLPALLLYPLLLDGVMRAKRRLVATEYAVEAITHPQELQKRLERALRQLDELPDLARIVSSVPRLPGVVQTDTALALWRQTDLATFRLTSAVEIYAADGPLLSRFALNFPEYEATVNEWHGTACTWDVFAEALPFGSEERPMLHAERAVCAVDPATGRQVMVGGLILHVMLDYNALPFLSTQGPYFDLFRAGEPQRPQDLPQRDVDLVLYGWGRSAIYSSASRVWPLPDDVFDRAYASREAFWATQQRGDRLYDIHVSNDRLALYVVGFPRTRLLGHLVHLAEIATLAGVATILLLGAVSLLHRVNRRGPQPGTLLVREIRASFTRKLFLAFVATSVIPVLTLALLVRTFVTARLLADVEAEATRTASVAQRVIEESLAVQQPGYVTTRGLSDDIMVWISRVISQDVNIFVGSTLRATSQRDLFQSGLLPERTPDSVYRAIALQRLPSVVTEDQIGSLRYRLAAAPIRVGGREAILTVPMTLRQQEIESEITELDRHVNLGVVVFILLGAFLGYSMAERIGDPVQRLTRASRRIAAGDLDQRVVARTADELQRLVEAFNGMAAELSRQRVQLERTHRLEAWAEMARQVAHDIKNPLTPIQLSAEHLRRVHKDRGAPLSPVLDSCVDTILLQVRVLRQISSEFASFASTPTARVVSAPLPPIVAEVVDAYRTGLPERTHVTSSIADALPLVDVDRVLLGRAMTNIIENALHAMPTGGTVSIDVGRAGAEHVAIAIRDTGLGMDEEAMARLFEPYFSTKATGTGLGLSIARRNIELMGGDIDVVSRRGVGTTVTLRVRVTQ